MEKKESITSLYDKGAGQVWKYFGEICEIPRPSKYEDRCREYLLKIARTRNWRYWQDKAGNVAFVIPGRGKLAHSPILVIQAHMDMVCEKNSDVNHDFMKDPIVAISDGVWVGAAGTTLGADNGLGLALMLALADFPFEDCVPLELLFTIDEETGLTGAMNLEKSIVKGRTLLNLDSEDEGVLTIGCAGGQDMMAKFNRQAEALSCDPCWEVQIKGMQGGHSGVNIHEKRANAILGAANYLQKLKEICPQVVLVKFEGGNKKNAIPREARITVANCSSEQLSLAAEMVLAEIKPYEKNVEIITTEIDSEEATLISWEVVDFLLNITHGVVAMDPNFPNLVQTSVSIGVIRDYPDHVSVLAHGRSSSKEALKTLERDLREKASSHNGKFETGPSFPGWNPNPNSNILKKGITIYESLFGNKPTVMAMHAGLETGVLGEILEIDELLSIGPTIEDPHSPDERVHIKSVEKTFEFLKAFVSQTG